jgi:hypothetical protein
MTAELRRFPRISFDKPGELRVPVHYADPDAELRSVPVSVGTLSCQGAGIVVANGEQLVAGTTCELVISVAGRSLALPARVVWAAGARAGLRLRLANTAPVVKRTFADWIVPLTNKAIAAARL